MSGTVNSPEQPPKQPEATAKAKPTKATAARPTSIFLVPYPKIVFLYPTFLAAILAGIVLTITGRWTVAPDDLLAVTMTWVFLVVLGVNAIVLGFDFPRTTWLTMIFLLAAVVLAAILAFTLRPQWLPFLGSLLQSIRPVANATFFLVVVVLMALIYGAVLISVRFDYWEVRPNELLHHHGFLSDLKRYSAPHLRIDKEINDVFEYLLLGSGRLILQPSGERRAIILDNIPFITQKETQITQMLGALQVEVRSEKE